MKAKIIRINNLFMQNMGSKVKYSCFLLMFVSLFTFGQTATKTVTLNYTQRQGATLDCFFNPCRHSLSQADETLFDDAAGAPVRSPKYKNARYRFDHPDFKNKDITKIVLELRISKTNIPGNTINNVQSGFGISVPLAACNTSVPWTPRADAKALYLCNNSGNPIHENGVGTNSSSPETVSLILYDKGASGFPSETLQHFNQEGNSFTLAFFPLRGWVKIHQIKTKVTYEGELPAVPEITSHTSTTNSVRLNWSNSIGATSYEVFTCTGTKLGTTSSTSYTITELASGTNYCYKVRALNSLGASGFSSDFEVETEVVPTPSTPTLSVNAIGIDWVGFTMGQSTNATKYQVYDCNGNEIAEYESSGNFTFQITELAPDTNYCYKARAANNGGVSSFSEDLSVRTEVAPIPTVPDLYGSQRQVDYIRIFFNPSDNATEYEVFGCEGNFIGTTTSTSYKITGLDPDTRYCFKVRAKNKYLVSDFSQNLMTSTQEAPVPETPIITNHSTSQTQISIYWNEVADATGYKVRMRRSDGTGITSPVSNTFHTVRFLEPETKYTFWVQAIGQYGESNYSAAKIIYTSPKDCTHDSLLLQNVTETSVKEYRVNNNIEVVGSTFKAGSNTNARARRQIIIRTGTRVEEGSRTVFTIKPCTSNRQTNSKSDTTIADIKEELIESDSFIGHMDLYPNPSKNEFTVIGIDWGKVKNSQVRIYNMMGALQMQKTIHKASNSVNIEHLSEGIYIVYISDAKGKNYSKKLVVRK
ncbi:T9SS C-terminal target domain-containing protein [Aquimarina sp. AD10]|uniref:fibronectin type III domain-containing protein n=1 Tax=Aquimarina sp. AD10 TaxID=1714849 RepID=UPI000E4E5564|nr:fibronectin type III domain-containing protein [Aquimarina sp. AD10]AXT62483.1 T9SS C-terminal target domain-containing protein [Aquimarina sp. AD10]RKM90325.1 T9SS C-terminal target domain-containing protein [Aquimarina sp. AD10]